MKKKLIVLSVLVAIFAWMGITLASNKKKIAENSKVIDRSGIAIPVTVAQAFTGSAAGSLTVAASLEPATEADITVSTPGKVTDLKVELGSHVRKGQTIGSLDNTLKELNLKSTELSLDKLKKDYDRYKDLYQAKAATEVNYNDVRFNYENTKVQAEQIRQQIRDGHIVAPLNGIVVRKNTEVGEYVNPGAVIATVVDVSNLKAMVLVNEKSVYDLKAGQSVTVRSDVYPDKKFQGTIRYISPRGDESHNYAVEVNIQNTGQALKAGTFVRVDFNMDNKGQALQIPRLALAEGVKNPYVYIIKGDRAEVRKLVVGREIGENIEVISGLQNGETVIVSGQINLRNGSPVQVVKSNQ